MKKNVKHFHKILSLLLVCAICLSSITCVSAAGKTAKKAKKPVITLKSCSNYLIPTYENYGIGSISGLKKNAVVTVTSSDEAVCTVEYNKTNKIIYAHALKPGKVTIKCTVTQGEKTYTKKCKYEILKYKNPLSSLKIGNKNYAPFFNESTDTIVDGIKGKQKVSVKVKKGYKLVRLYIYKNGEQVTVKNGSKIDIKKNALYIEVKDKKKKMITFGIYPS